MGLWQDVVFVDCRLIFVTRLFHRAFMQAQRDQKSSGKKSTSAAQVSKPPAVAGRVNNVTPKFPSESLQPPQQQKLSEPDKTTAVSTDTFTSATSCRFAKTSIQSECPVGINTNLPVKGQGLQGAVNTELPLISPGQAGVSTGPPLKDLPQSKVDSGRRRQDFEVNAEMTGSSTRQVETALEWRLIAMILDRICLCLFCVVTLVTSVVILSNH